MVHDFTAALIADMTAREPRLGPVTPVAGTADILRWATRANLAEVIAPHIPTGPAKDATEGLARALSDAGIRLTRPLRPYDAAAWPHATHGFFRFREAIPRLLGDIQGWRLL
jgi:deoxyribodipyrimidine photo-lyase